MVSAVAIVLGVGLVVLVVIGHEVVQREAVVRGDEVDRRVGAAPAAAVEVAGAGEPVAHAARLPLIERVFHVGGDVDFDNPFRWLAPWPLLHSGKIVLFPARRPFRCGNWTQVPHTPLRANTAKRSLSGDSRFASIATRTAWLPYRSAMVVMSGNA